MALFINITGEKFNEWTVMSISDKRSNNNRILWKCKCSCGKISNLLTSSLTNGFSKSCGCKYGRNNKLDLKNKRFGRLIVIEDSGQRLHGHLLWKCQCDCEKFCKVKGIHLRKGITKSCGCLHKELMSEKFSLKLTGKKFGRLTAINRVKKRHGEWLWKCKCDCGNEYITSGRTLKNRYHASCGCWEKEIISKIKVIDLKGKKFGRLTVIKQYGRTKEKSVIWECKCECGKIHKTTTALLTGGHVQSCNCYRIDRLKMVMAESSYKDKIKMILQSTHMERRGELKLV